MDLRRALSRIFKTTALKYVALGVLFAAQLGSTHVVLADQARHLAETLTQLLNTNFIDAFETSRKPLVNSFIEPECFVCSAGVTLKANLSVPGGASLEIFPYTEAQNWVLNEGDTISGFQLIWVRGPPPIL